MPLITFWYSSDDGCVDAGVNDRLIGEGVFGFAPGCLGSDVVVPAQLMVPMPSNVSFEDAATTPTCFVTVYTAFEKMRVAAGDKVRDASVQADRCNFCASPYSVRPTSPLKTHGMLSACSTDTKKCDMLELQREAVMPAPIVPKCCHAFNACLNLRTGRRTKYGLHERDVF